MDNIKFYTNRKNIIFIAIICTFLWGSAYPAIKIGYDLFEISQSDIGAKLVFAGYRFALAGIIVLFYERIINKKSLHLNKEGISKITILGLGQTTLQYLFFYIGMANTTGVRGSIMNGTGTFFSIILAHFLYSNDKLNKNKILGCLIGFLGIFIVNIGGESIVEGNFKLNGEGFLIIAAFLLSISSIYSKNITKKRNPSIVTGYQLFIGGLILVFLGIVMNGKLNNFNVQATALLVYMALISSVAFVLWSKLLKYNKVGEIAVFNFLIPVFGTILSGIFLKENIFNFKILISILLVSLGIYFVYRKDIHK